MENKKLTYYNIYGYVIAIDEELKPSFDLEYWRFISKQEKKVDMYIVKSNKKDLPIKLRGENRGISITFNEGTNIVEYESGVPGDWVLYTVEPLIYWKDKCFLHCGAVSKNNKAIIFPAEGGVGKTSTVTKLINHNYEYLSDDWLIVGKNGLAYPFFKTIHVFHYNLKNNKRLQKIVLGNKRWYYNSIFFVLSIIPKIFPHRFTRIICERVEPIFSVDFNKLHPELKISKPCPISHVFWLKKDKKTKKAYLKKSDYIEVSKKMPYINALETDHFYKNYLEWVYSNKQNKSIENRLKHNQEILKSAFKKARVYELYVPEKIDTNEVKKIIEEII